MNSKVAKELNDVIKEGIKNSLSRSQSPVKGYGRLTPYAAEIGGARGKTSTALDTSKYPFSVQHKYPGKKIRPINLQLSGKMIDSIKVISISNDKVTIGVSGTKQKLMAETHNEGTQEPRVPTRRFMPTADGEEFVGSIQTKILAIIEKRVFDLIKGR